MKYDLFQDKSIEKMYFEFKRKYQRLIFDSLKKNIVSIFIVEDEETRNAMINSALIVYQLTRSQLEEYMLFVKLESLYDELVIDVNTINELTVDFDSIPDELIDEVILLGNQRNKFMVQLGELEKMQKRDKEEVKEENFVENTEISNLLNFVIFLDSVDEDRDSTINSVSGKSDSSIKSIVKEIKNLINTDYQGLRSAAKIHHIKDYNGLNFCIDKYGVNYERVGGGRTKVGFIKVPICEKNIKLLSDRFNNFNWKYLFLIISFGNFHNESLEEKELYSKMIRSANSNMNEIEKIIEIFINPFTEETYELACYLVQHGYDNFTLLSNNPEMSLLSNKVVRK